MNKRAAHEYKKIIDTVGETVDAEDIAKKLGKKHSSFARLIEVNEVNLIDTLKQGVLPGEADGREIDHHRFRSIGFT